jgi:RimJ/RimL family protein N-acetyltransferase
MYMLSDKRVGLRGMTRNDLPLYREWLSDSEVTRYLEMGWRPLGDDDLEGIYREATSGHAAVVFVIEEKESGRAIGTTGLYLLQWPCRRAQFRILMGVPEIFDRGYGTEATALVVGYGFERLNLETIYLGVNADNVRAVRSYEKSGFVHEGRQRRFIYGGGTYHDCINMSILRSEYESARQK